MKTRLKNYLFKLFFKQFKNLCDLRRHILDSLGSAKYFQVFDLLAGFHHIKMNPKDSHKTTIATPHGYFEFHRMPFGLKPTPATFQRLMDLTLTGLI